MDTLFISDLHLSPARPAMLELFKQLLREAAREAKALYILGDLFEEFWVGIDDITPPNPDIVRELAGYTAGGKKLYIQRGNRDLLLNRKFGELTGAEMLPDFAVTELDGNRVLLMHGDLLCTRDQTYQIYRRVVNTPLIRKLFTSLPYRARTRLAHGLRPTMQKSTSRKSGYIMDVEQTAVKRILRTHSASELIHGHTHHPGIFEFDLDGKPARRIVLGDWYENGKILVCRGDTRELVPVSEYLQRSR